jgi:chromosome segregation ATPase
MEDEIIDATPTEIIVSDAALAEDAATTAVMHANSLAAQVEQNAAETITEALEDVEEITSNIETLKDTDEWRANQLAELSSRVVTLETTLSELTVSTQLILERLPEKKIKPEPESLAENPENVEVDLEKMETKVEPENKRKKRLKRI